MECKPTYKGVKYDSEKELYEKNGVSKIEYSKAVKLFSKFFQESNLNPEEFNKKQSTISQEFIAEFRKYIQNLKNNSKNFQQKETIEVKPGVSELFESNAELANSVYESLGFNKIVNKELLNKVNDTLNKRNNEDTFEYKNEWEKFINFQYSNFKKGEITKEELYKKTIEKLIRNKGDLVTGVPIKNLPAFHGSFQKLKGDIDISKSGLELGKDGDVNYKKGVKYNKPAIFASSSREIAETYSKNDFDETVGEVNDVLINFNNPLVIDAQNMSMTSDVLIGIAIDYASNNDYDGIVVKGINDSKNEDWDIGVGYTYISLNNKGIIRNNQITPQQKQEAQQIYSQYLKTTNNPTIDGFKKWNENKDVKSNVNELFNSNPELANKVYEALGFGTLTQEQKQQAQEVYSQYLNTIFPNSKVKDIVYHGTDFNKDNVNFKTDRGGIFLASTSIYASYFSEQENVYPALINFNNIYQAKKLTDDIGKEEISKIKAKKFDSVIGKGGISKMQQHKNDLEYIAFEPEQIHILGGKQDIESFKKFVNNKFELVNTSRNNLLDLFDSQPEVFKNMDISKKDIENMNNSQIEETIKKICS